MGRVEGALARRLDFEEDALVTRKRTDLRLAPAQSTRSKSDKYGLLEHRRRQAQIKARHLLDLVDGEDGRYAK